MLIPEKKKEEEEKRAKDKGMEPCHLLIGVTMR